MWKKKQKKSVTDLFPWSLGVKICSPYVVWNKKKLKLALGCGRKEYNRCKKYIYIDRDYVWGPLGTKTMYEVLVPKGLRTWSYLLKDHVHNFFLSGSGTTNLNTYGFFFNFKTANAVAIFPTFFGVSNFLHTLYCNISFLNIGL